MGELGDTPLEILSRCPWTLDEDIIAGGWKKEQHGSAPYLALHHVVPEPGKANGSLDGSYVKRGEQGEHEKVSNLHQKVDI